MISIKNLTRRKEADYEGGRVAIRNMESDFGSRGNMGMQERLRLRPTKVCGQRKMMLIIHRNYYESS